MTRNTKQKTDNKSMCVRVRLSPEEHALIMKRAKGFTGGNLSKYIRFLLLNEKITLRYHNTTADLIGTKLTDFTSQIKKIGTNFNQVARFIQSKNPPIQIESLLATGNEMMKDIRDYAYSAHNLLKQLEQAYIKSADNDSKNQQKQ